MVTTLNPDSAKVGSQVGRSVPRLEGRDKVTGRAEYTHTMRVPGMLYAKLFRSTVAHGKIKSIDTSAAKKLPGVLHVVTVDDVMKVLKSPYYGPAFHDQPILAHEKVRFVGEPVAAVIATDPHIAEQAVQLITAEYEELPAVYDEVDALTSKVYRARRSSSRRDTFADLKHLKDAKNTNLALDYQLRRGDFDKAYAAAAHKFEHEFKTQKVLHLSFEPFACICRLQGHPRHVLRLVAGPVVRAHRDRAPARLAGEQGARSRCRISARATAPSSTSSSRRWRSRCR